MLGQHIQKHLIKWFRSQKYITEHTWSKRSSSCSFSSLSSSLSSASKSSSLALSALSCFLVELAVRTCLISSTILRTCFSSRCGPETWEKQILSNFSSKKQLRDNKQNHWDFRTAQNSTQIHVQPWHTETNINTDAELYGNIMIWLQSPLTNPSHFQTTDRINSDKQVINNWTILKNKTSIVQIVSFYSWKIPLWHTSLFSCIGVHPLHHSTSSTPLFVRFTWWFYLPPPHLAHQV